jgi:hypothetical protein
MDRREMKMSDGTRQQLETAYGARWSVESSE